LLSMDNLVQDNGVTRICCPRNDDRSVQLTSGIEQRILFRDFRLCMAASSHAQPVNQANPN
jgi:hypothetical protein